MQQEMCDKCKEEPADLELSDGELNCSGCFNSLYGPGRRG